MTDKPIDLLLIGGARVDKDDPTLCGDCRIDSGTYYGKNALAACKIFVKILEKTPDGKCKRTPECLQAEKDARELIEEVKRYREIHGLAVDQVVEQIMEE